MKAHSFLLIFIGLILICPAQNSIDKQGRKQGHWIKTDKQGHKIFEGNFKDGHETGVFEYFYSDGTVRLRNTFVGNDGKRCHHEAYDEKGRLLAKGDYCLKNRDGRWDFFAEDGKLIKTANYKMGIKEINQVLTIDDMVKGDDCMFTATAITDSTLLKGIRYFGGGVRTHSISMRYKTGTVRFVDAVHKLEDSDEQFSVKLF